MVSARGGRAHPWHGVPIGDDAPRRVTAYVEIVPTDTVKYEMDKATGILRVDRPQQYSNVCPSLYGFLPRTLCGERVCPPGLVERLRHYFLTYKQGPDRVGHIVEITHVYDHAEAYEAIRRSLEDYAAHRDALIAGSGD